MENREITEREISLREIFWSILLGWRMAICLGLITALVLAGYKYVKDSGAVQGTQDATESGITADEIPLDEKMEAAKLTKEEKKQILAVQQVDTQQKALQDYQDRSVLMKIDPFEKHIVVLQYYIESDYTYNYTQENRRDYTNDLAEIYRGYIKGGELGLAVTEGAGLSISQADWQELIKVSGENAYIAVEITSPAEKLDVIAKALKAQLSNKTAELQMIGAHQLKLAAESQNVVVDQELLKQQNLLAQNIADLDTKRTTLKATMTASQLKLLGDEEDTAGSDQKAGAGGANTGTGKTDTASRFSVGGYAALGGVFGIFLACFLAAGKLIFTGKLQDPDEIRTRYGVCLLGEVDLPPEKKKFLPVIDEKLLAIKNRNRKMLSQEQQIHLAATNAALSCRQKGAERIYLTGSGYDTVDPEILEKFRKELSAQKIQVREGGNIRYDAESLRQSAEVGTILFVEQAGKSICDEIASELNLAEEQKSNILGVVVLV